MNRGMSFRLGGYRRPIVMNAGLRQSPFTTWTSMVSPALVRTWADLPMWVWPLMTCVIFLRARTSRLSVRLPY